MEKIIRKSINSQYRTNRNRSLFYPAGSRRGGKTVLKISPFNTCLLTEAGGLIPDYIRNAGEKGKLRFLVSHLAQKTIRTFTRVNQFLDFTSGQIKRLEGLYLRFLSEMESLYRAGPVNREKREELFQRHYQRLSEYLLKTNGKEILKKYKTAPSVRRTVCAEYSPAFQMTLLGLERRTLKEPVLDLGCGEKAGLVRYLREQGINAYGLDRSGRPSRFIIRKNWFDIKLGESAWGTIIAHQSFTNHFRHHHHRKDGRFRVFAEKTMEILAALKPGGAFIYAPGLPFFEKILEQNRAYRISRKPRAGEVVTIKRIGI